MKDYGLEFWNRTWSKNYDRYNRHHKEIWEAIIPYLKGNIVDLGCGPAVMYKEKKVSLIGIDWSEEALQQARINCPWGLFILGDAGKTGLPPAQFDTVIISGLLDYFEDWTDLLTEAKRLLRKNGKIIATLFKGFNGRHWTEEMVKKKADIKSFRHVTGSWHIIEL